ncbi:hypothetical protein EDEG_01054 [Edhazardia aedis USNM 41457]|uniref:Uncharacterized protein n=1 Tax=Edhazardia aedis (strain USNM 41457) TaxID=1003232 RepID=J9DB94_EDHAE|nr:hypothetical protein EDEG_01054 [Edhazardia aedis USNM 41457]|eukprot:EJW04764.1 hypothetical protein EDEG_01054 [Edhazardia aedis USNM 41457]
MKNKSENLNAVSRLQPRNRKISRIISSFIIICMVTFISCAIFGVFHLKKYDQEFVKNLRKEISILQKSTDPKIKRINSLIQHKVFFMALDPDTKEVKMFKPSINSPKIIQNILYKSIANDDIGYKLKIQSFKQLQKLFDQSKSEKTLVADLKNFDSIINHEMDGFLSNLGNLFAESVCTTYMAWGRKMKTAMKNSNYNGDSYNVVHITDEEFRLFNIKKNTDFGNLEVVRRNIYWSQYGNFDIKDMSLYCLYKIFK